MQPTESNAEPVNTEVIALPIPDVYLYEANPQTTHLVNGTEYVQARWRDNPVTTLCGSVDVPVGPDDDLPTGVQHFADTLSPDTVTADPEGVMDLTVLDNLCLRCRGSYGREGVPADINVVRFEMDGSGWNR